MASAQVVETSVNNNSPSQDSNHPDDLFQSRYEDVMIPVHLGMEKHWLLVVISVENLCIYIYHSVCSSPSTYRTIFDISIYQISE